MSGLTSLLIVTLTNIFLLVQCIRLYIENSVKAARRVMFSSYVHLPIVLLALLGNKLPPSPEGGLGSLLNLVQ
jgi:protoheme IX farnesyltransferase